MRELKNTARLKTEELAARSVTLFIQSKFFLLSGNWYWDGQADALFCSDVMLSLPTAFAGIKGILHPDDVNAIREKLLQQKNMDLEFRIITSYGEVRTIFGNNIRIEETQTDFESLSGHLLNTASEELVSKHELEQLQLIKEIYEKNECYTNTGTWWYNDATNETWYSVQVFRIYDLPPYSLNPHLNTFTPFIHPEDKELVREFIDKAYRERIPLHIEYRIKTAGSVKWVLHISQWHYNAKGEEVLSGTIRDITEQKTDEQRIEETERKNQFYRQQIFFDEQNASIGHWQGNLLTRKTVYSDNYYRIFGLRPQAVPAGLSGIINYIHPDDHETVSIANKKMIHEHKAPELEFRIIRTDGKLRYLVQKARVVPYGNEMIMTGTIQDVTVQRMLEQKVKELTEAATIKNFVYTQAEEMAEMANWVWDIETGEIKWSDNFYRMLGYKPSTIQLSQKLFLQFIHPDDQKIYNDELKMIRQERQERTFNFRLIQKGKIRHIKAVFRIMANGETELFIGSLLDITNEQSLQQELSQRMQLAEALSENILDRLIITDINNVIISWNKPCEITYNIKKEDAVGKNFFDVFPKHKTEEALQNFNKVLQGESVSQAGKRSVLGRGYYDLHMLPLWRQGNSEVTGIIHIIHDVTQETELRQNLSDRLSLISNIVESSVDRIIALDRNMNYLVWNKKCEEFYSLKKEFVVGKNVLEIFPSVANSPTYEHFRRVLKGETIYLPATEDGHQYEVYLLPVKNEKQEINAILWIEHDLSKEIGSEKRLKEQSKLFEAVFNASADGIILFKAIRDEKDMITDYEVILNNAITQKWNGRSLVGEKYAEIFPSIKTAGLFDAYNKVMETGEPLDMEMFYEGEGFKNWFRIKAVKISGDQLVTTAEDITSRKIAEGETKKNLTLLRYTEYLAQSGSWEYEIATENFIWSEGMFKLFGLPQQMKVRPETYLDFAMEEDRSTAKKIINSLKKKHEPFEEVVRIKRNDEVRTLKIKASVVHDKNGKPNKIVGVDLDITNMQKTEEKLKESRHWLQQMANASPDSITIYDLQNKQPLYLNNCLAEWTGKTLQELVDMGIDGRLKLIHEDDRLPLLQFNAGFASANDTEVVTMEYRLKNKNGEVLWLRNRSKVFQRDANGKVSHILSFLQDVTEEIRLREELKRRSEYAETILDASVDRITVFDRNYRFVGWNKRCSQIHGYSREEVLGKTVFEMFPGLENYPEFINAQERSLQGEYVHVPMVRDEFTNGYLELFYVPLKNETGETYAVVNIMHDVTEYVNHTKAVNALNLALENKNMELARKNEEITHFAFVASHDMKEPLRKIQTFSDWILQQEADQLSPKGRTMLEKMNTAVKRMDLLLEDILVLTKIHTNTQKDAEVDLNNVLVKVQEDMADLLQKTQSSIQADDLPVIKGNGNQVFHLFKNLIGNAIKFQKPGNAPHVKITAEMVKGGAPDHTDTQEEYVKISFIDNGFGFDQRYAKKIFQVFQRLHGKHEFEGTGIGLAICKKIMENHNGSIEVKSEQGKGSSFSCYFPLT